MAPTPPVAVTGIGMVSNLGVGAIGSCASARAGLTRVSELGLDFFDYESGETIWAKGCVAPNVSSGFESVGRLLALAAAALKDLLDQGLRDRWSADVRVVVHLSDRLYERLHFEKELAEQTADSDLVAEAREMFQAEESERQDFLRTSFVDRMLRMNGIASSIGVGHVSFGGVADAVDALRLAMSNVVAGSARRCVFVGVDSLVESPTVEALDALGLLHSDINPGGFVPGEAAACVLLEAIDLPTATKAQKLGVIAEPVSRAGLPYRIDARLPDSAVLATAIESAIEMDGVSRPVDYMIGVSNGDELRAREIGTALVSLAGKDLLARTYTHISACESFGEIGAASLPVLICMALRGFARGYIDVSRVLLWLISDDGQRAAVMISKA